MLTPFPGMDPYLERPNLWHGIHNRLIALLADLLGPLLSPRYFVAVEERSYVDELPSAQLMTVPDVGVLGSYTSQPVTVVERLTNVAEPQLIELPISEPVRETYLSIQEIGSSGVATEMWLEGEDGLKVVTILEILSPWNKSSRDGRAHYSFPEKSCTTPRDAVVGQDFSGDLYMRKRNAVFNSYTNLVEIDLLRSGLRFTKTRNNHYHYSILVSAASMRPRAHFYPFTVRQPIPIFRLPLQEDDEWPAVDLNTILHELYARARYDLRINYRIDPIPAFTTDCSHG